MKTMSCYLTHIKARNKNPPKMGKLFRYICLQEMVLQNCKFIKTVSAVVKSKYWRLFGECNDVVNKQTNK